MGRVTVLWGDAGLTCMRNGDYHGAIIEARPCTADRMCASSALSFMVGCVLYVFNAPLLRAHVYVFKKIRFRKDPFWGVHTYRTSTRRPRSHGRGLIPGNVPPPENHGLCVRTRLDLKAHFFRLFPLLASVILLYCFTCLCPVEGVYVVCESWRQMIKERLQRQNETQTKDEAKSETIKKSRTPYLRLRRRRGRVASEDNSNYPPFCFRRQLLSKQKKNELLPVSATRLQMHVKQYSSLGHASFDRLGNSGRKDPDTMFTRKKIRIRNLRFRKIHFRERFRKAPFWGPSVFKKLRIRADTCDRFYESGVEKLRFRKDPGTCARSLSFCTKRFRSPYTCIGRPSPFWHDCSLRCALCRSHRAWHRSNLFHSLQQVERLPKPCLFASYLHTN